MRSMHRVFLLTSSMWLAHALLGCSEGSDSTVSVGDFPTPAQGFGSDPVIQMVPSMLCSGQVNPEGVTPGPGEGAHFRQTSPVRRDIAEGLPGLNLKLVIRLIEAGRCTALNSVQVDVWHADASGRYSEPEAVDAGAQAGTFLRGTQFTDDAGLVVFETIFPGWTKGRSPLIHVKVHHKGPAPVIGQEVYFDEEVALAVFAEEPYATRGKPDTTPQTDPWQSQIGSANRPAAVAVTTQDGDQLVAEATLFVQSGATQQF